MPSADAVAVPVPVRLNVGCGSIRIPGEIGVDREPTEERDVEGDALALPFEDGAASFVRLDHVLEHLPYRMAVPALLEAKRVLARGGIVHIGIPDLRETCRQYAAAESLSDRAFLLRHLYGSQAHAGEFHQAGWDPETLRDLLESCGFVDVRVWPDTERQEGACIQAEGCKL